MAPASSENAVPGRPGSSSQGLPFRTPFFYGWLIVALSYVAATFSGVTSQLFMSIMVKPMSADLGWSRTEISGALAVGVFATASLAPFLGRLTDRKGPRLLMAGGAVVVALGLGLMATMGALWQLYLGYGAARGVAQSALSGVVPYTTITNWFSRQRGRAIGLFGVAFPLAPVFLLPFAQWLIATRGWRSVFGVFAVGTLALLVLPALALLRRRPEDVGLYPDGAEGPPERLPSRAGHRSGGGELDFTVSQAMRTPTFWLLVGSQFIALFISGGVSFHLAVYLGDAGIPTAVIATALSLYSITNGLSSGLWGYLTEHVSERHIGMVATAAGSGIVLALMGVRNPLLAVAAVTAYGFVVRGENATLGLIIARYFGRASYGAISGTLVPIGYVGLGIGPLVGSMLYDRTLDYGAFWWMLAACHILNLLLLGLALQPKAPAAGASSELG